MKFKFSFLFLLILSLLSCNPIQSQKNDETKIYVFSKCEREVGLDYDKKDLKTTIIITDKIVQITSDDRASAFYITKVDKGIIIMEERSGVMTDPLDYTFTLTVDKDGSIEMQSLRRTGEFPQRLYFYN